MKYTYKDLEGEQNVSTVSPLKEFALYTGGIVAILVLLFFFLGQVVDLVADYLPQHFVDSIYSQGWGEIGKYDQEATPELQQLFVEVARSAGFNPEQIKLAIINQKDENAFATLSHTIAISNTLLKNVESENELAFILAHELGHFQYRHHLKSLGRGLFLVSLSMLFSVQSQGVGDSLTNIVNFSTLHFSREQEEQADRFGLDVVEKLYGHVNGTLSFFKRFKQNHHFEIRYASTHPISKRRVALLQDYAKQHGYLFKGDITPWKGL